MSHWTRAAWLSGAVMVAALAPGLRACDISADPSVQIKPQGGDVLEEDCSLGVTKVVVDEGTSLTLDAQAVDGGAGSCDAVDWGSVIDGANNYGGNFKIEEVFFRGGGGPAAGMMGIIEFLTGPGTKYESNFSFTITDPVMGNNNGGSTIADFISTLARIGQAVSSPPSGVQVGTPSISGTFKPMPDDMRIFWKILPSTGDVDTDYGNLFTDNVGHNVSVTPGERETPVGTPITVTFDTPTLPLGDSGANGPFYAVYAEAALPWQFNQWVTISAPACQLDTTTSPPPCNSIGNVSVRFAGTIVKQSNPTSLRTNGPDGHPALCLIAVRDVTAPLGAKVVSSTQLAEAQSGGPPPGDSIEIELYDNNPYGNASDYTARAWALYERSHWEGGPGTRYEGIRHDDTAHGSMGDDCHAGSKGHELRWVPLGEVTASGATPVAIGGKPAGLRVQFPSFNLTEPMGTHYAVGAVAGDNWTDWVDRPFKVVYQIEENLNGARPAAPPPDAATFAELQDWAEEIQEGYVTGGGTVPHPGGTVAGVDGASLAASCGECAGWKLVGVPTWNVVDRLPPSVVILAHDTKYDKWYYFGENFAGDADQNDEFLVAYSSGQGGSPDDENLAIAPYAGSTDWNRNGQDGGFQNQIAGYMSDFFPSCANVAGNGGDYSGLWIDEDTRVEFFANAWDNVNGWVEGAGSGIDTIEFQLVDNPTGANDGRSFGARGESLIHLFRNPNRPTALRGSLGEAYVQATATDKAGNSRSVKVQIYIADNSLRIYSLEENRRRSYNE